jgi:hypothetical protein
MKAKKDWVDIALEEYKTLRTESLEALNGQQSTLKFGTTIAGAIVLSGFNLWDKTFLPDIIFLVFIPLICYIILVIWLGDVARMMRAGYFITLIENKISKAYPEVPDVLSFENWLRLKHSKSKTNQIPWKHIFVAVLFVMIAISSIVVGNLKIYDKICIKVLFIYDGAELFVFIIFMIYIIKTALEFKKI